MQEKNVEALAHEHEKQLKSPKVIFRNKKAPLAQTLCISLSLRERVGLWLLQVCRLYFKWEDLALRLKACIDARQCHSSRLFLRPRFCCYRPHLPLCCGGRMSAVCVFIMGQPCAVQPLAQTLANGDLQCWEHWISLSQESRMYDSTVTQETQVWAVALLPVMQCLPCCIISGNQSS